MDYQRMVAEQVGQGILQVAQAEEQMLDQQLRELEALGNYVLSEVLRFS